MAAAGRLAASLQGVLFAGGQRVVLTARGLPAGLSPDFRTATTSCRASAGGGGTSAGGCWIARAAEGAEGYERVLLAIGSSPP
ncbi:MAG: hypothetical protein R3B90_00610 [Planctomycetaceae bacterium]